jgi:hypothetical protein
MRALALIMLLLAEIHHVLMRFVYLLRLFIVLFYNSFVHFYYCFWCIPIANFMHILLDTQFKYYTIKTNKNKLINLIVINFIRLEIYTYVIVKMR